MQLMVLDWAAKDRVLSMVTDSLTWTSWGQTKINRIDKFGTKLSEGKYLGKDQILRRCSQYTSKDIDVTRLHTLTKTFGANVDGLWSKYQQIPNTRNTGNRDSLHCLTEIKMPIAVPQSQLTKIHQLKMFLSLEFVCTNKTHFEAKSKTQTCIQRDDKRPTGRAWLFSRFIYPISASVLRTLRRTRVVFPPSWPIRAL